MKKENEAGIVLLALVLLFGAGVAGVLYKTVLSCDSHRKVCVEVQAAASMPVVPKFVKTVEYRPITMGERLVFSFEALGPQKPALPMEIFAGYSYATAESK